MKPPQSAVPFDSVENRKQRCLRAVRTIVPLLQVFTGAMNIGQPRLRSFGERPRRRDLGADVGAVTDVDRRGIGERRLIEQDGPERIYGNAALDPDQSWRDAGLGDGRDQTLDRPVGQRVEIDAFAPLRIEANAAAGAKPRYRVTLDQLVERVQRCLGQFIAACQPVGRHIVKCRRVAEEYRTCGQPDLLLCQ